MSATSMFSKRIAKAVCGSSLLLFLACWLSLAGPAFAAAPAAGTLITNQSSVTFTDSAGAKHSAVSNLVKLNVGQVASFTLVANTAKSAVPGATAYFPHTLVNTGNGTDSFNFTLMDLPGGYGFASLKIFADSDGNGVPDDNAALTGTGSLAAGASFRFVIAAVVPDNANSGSRDQFRLDAVSNVDPVVSTAVPSSGAAALIDTVNAVSGPQLMLNKTVSSATAKPNDTLSYMLTLRNTGGSTATSGPAVQIDGAAATPVLVRDVIPPNTRLVAFNNPTSPGMKFLYHRLGDAEHTYTTAPPADLRQVDAIALAVASLAQAAAVDFSFSVQLNSNAASNGDGTITNIARGYFNNGVSPEPTTFLSNAAVSTLTPVAAAIRNFTDQNHLIPADYARLGSPLYLSADAAACNSDPSVTESRVVIVTGPNGEHETFIAVETGPNTGVFTLSPMPTKNAPVVADDKLIEAKSSEEVTVEILGCGKKIVTTITLIDPAGVLFNSLTNEPVSGATVTLMNGNGAGGCSSTPAIVRRFADGLIKSAPSTVVTGADGRYEFELADPGSYCLAITPPAGFAFPSQVPAGKLPAGRKIMATGPASGGSYGGSFSISLQSGPVIIDVPLDPAPTAGLFVQKIASRKFAEIGDTLDYTVKIRNNSSQAMDTPGIAVTDDLPAGFAYQPGSARLNNQAIPDPAGGRGPRLAFNIGALNSASEAILTYRVRVGPGAFQGDGVNRATASFGNIRSNEGSAKVAIQGGVFSDRGFILGKVYLDCNRNGLQDEGEVGIPGVRVYLEDGTSAISDGYGRYSFYGIAPRTHVLKLDKFSLPAGAELLSLSNRNTGDPGSMFVDMKNGELFRADFAEGSCSAEVRKAVDARIASAPSMIAEPDRMLKSRMEADPQPRAPGDVKAQPASGVIGVAAMAGPMPAAVATPDASRADATARPVLSKPVEAKPAVVALEDLLPSLNNKFGFIDLKDKEVLPIAQTNVRIKGMAGTEFSLSVNGQQVSASRVGKRTTLQDKQLQAWEFIGVTLKPGRNELHAYQSDQFGNVRGSAAITLIAPGSLSRLEVHVPPAAIADGRTPAKVIVKLTDRDGVPVTTRTPVTLEAGHGRWKAQDLDPHEPGLQVFIEGGSGEFLLLPPDAPAATVIHAASGQWKAQAKLDFLPDLRPMTGAGLIEGVLNLRKLDSRALVPARKQDSFEQELTRFSRSFGDGRNQAAARAALFLKGKVKGEYLLTLAYDSDKETQQRLFRDIQPDEFYPVYGDSSLHGFDAQSTSKLYVRVDKNRSYLLYGDFTTQSAAEARKLGNYSRSLTGVKQHYESGLASINVFASRDSTRQVIDEIPANGTSGPYGMSLADAVENSEKVEILIRDRNQPGIVLASLSQIRFVDYEVERLSGRLIFRRPIPTLDPNFNPQSIRVTYEVDQGGKEFWVTGVDGQVRLSDSIEVGGVAVKDNNPQDNASLLGANATVRLGDKTWLTGEVARSDKQSVGQGGARRVELRHEGRDFRAQAQVARTDLEFDNPGAYLSRGRSEAGLKMAYRINERTLLKGEALRTEDAATGGLRDGAFVSSEYSLNEHLRAEIGMRHGKETGGPAIGGAAIGMPANPLSTGTTPNQFTSVKARLSEQLPAFPEVSLFTEYEQDIRDSDRKLAAIGGNYQISNRGRAYLRHEFISSLSGPYALNTTQTQNATAIGLDYDYMQDSHVFSEYRMRDALAGGDTEATLGLRNMWRLTDGVQMSTGLERVHTLSGSGANEAAAVTLGLDYAANPFWKGTARLELRNATTSDSLFSTLAVASRLSQDWTTLARNTVAITRNKGSLTGSRNQERLQAGLAYRDTQNNKWNGLGRIEHVSEKDDSQAGMNTKRRAEILSVHANYQASRSVVLNGRYAGKWVTDLSNGLDSKYNAHLLSGRIIHDLTDRWDLSVAVSTLMGGGGKSRQFGFGPEAGYRVTSNLWLSVGYNFFGFKDDELTGTDYTNRGFYLRLRFKFDEDLFRTGGAASGKMAGVALQ